MTYYHRHPRIPTSIWRITTDILESRRQYDVFPLISKITTSIWHISTDIQKSWRQYDVFSLVSKNHDVNMTYFHWYQKITTSIWHISTDIRKSRRQYDVLTHKKSDSRRQYDIFQYDVFPLISKNHDVNMTYFYWHPKIPTSIWRISIYAVKSRHQYDVFRPTPLNPDVNVTYFARELRILGTITPWRAGGSGRPASSACTTILSLLH